MKVSMYQVVSVFCILIISCKPPACEGWESFTNSNQGDSIAGLLLNDSSLGYFDTSVAVHFKSSTGFIVTLNRESTGKARAFQNLATRKETIHGECGDHFNIWSDYGVIEQQLGYYKSTVVAPSFAYCRTSHITTTDEDLIRAGKISGYDVISVIIKTPVTDYQFYLPFNGLSESKWKLIDSLSIHGVTYHGVYNVYHGNPSGGPIIPEGIYYVPEKKLIGFYMTNGETWGLLP